MKLHQICAAAGLTAALAVTSAIAQEETAEDSKRFTAERVFDIEYATNPQISPDGKTIIYVRHSMDRMTDRDTGHLWIIDIESGAQRPLLGVGGSAGAPSWSPDGSRVLYTSTASGKPELKLVYMDTGLSYSLAQFTEPIRRHLVSRWPQHRLLHVRTRRQAGLRDAAETARGREMG